MKNFRITVNGTAYDVSVEELGGASAPMPALMPAPTMPVPMPAPKPVAAPMPAPAAVPADAIKIPSPMPGTILDIKASVGDAVTKNQTIAILEAMKMENEIVTPEAGKVVSINVSKGASINTGDVIMIISR